MFSNLNTKEYIESGVLDLYVSGLLSIEEMRDVELKACQHTEVKQELVLLQDALERFAFKYALMPRPEVKERILKSIQALQDKSKVVAITPPAAADAEVDGHEIKDTTSSRPALSRLLIAATIVLIATLASVAYYFNMQFRDSLTQIAQLEEQQSGILKQVDQLQLSLKQHTEKVQWLTDANTVRIPMKGTEKSPASLALIYWNKETKAVYLDVKALPPADADTQYQLWFIDPVAGPVSAGVFELKTGELIRMTNAPDAAAFAVTLEPRGGSIQPTLNQMYVIGAVES